MKTRIITLVTIIFLSGLTVVRADKDSTLTRRFQIAFISPVSTNGMQCGRCVNNLSLNLLIGYSAGTEGFEAGGFANINKRRTKGMQVAGFANYTGEVMAGFQAAGFCSIVADSANGMQVGGFGAYTGGSFKGIQIGGNSCAAMKNVDGVQASGFANYADNIKGAQISGFANIARGDVDGIQISGFLNRARNVKGAQIGIVNIADSVKGISVGLFSFIRKGYRRYEFAGNEVFYLNASFKTGVRKFYNIFSAGARYDHKRVGWGIGYGIGSQIDLAPKVFLNAELCSYYLSYDNYIVTVANNLNRVNFDVGMQLTRHLEAFIGASYNIYISQWYNEDTREYGQDIAPYKMYSETWYDSDMKMWFGGQAGLRFKEF